MEGLNQSISSPGEHERHDNEACCVGWGVEVRGEVGRFSVQCQPYLTTSVPVAVHPTTLLSDPFYPLQVGSVMRTQHVALSDWKGWDREWMGCQREKCIFEFIYLHPLGDLVINLRYDPL